MSDRGSKKHFEKVFKGGTLDGMLELGKVIPLDSFEEGKKIVEEINKRNPKFLSMTGKKDEK